MMKKFFLNVIILTFCLLGIGCGNIKNKQIVQEAEIKSDMQNKDVFAKHTIPITTINIIKRQTNIKDKEDIIYVTINGKNEDVSVVRNYKLKYILYNEGWALDTISEYSDEEHFDETVPLHGIDRQIVEDTFNDYFEEGNFLKRDFYSIDINEYDIELISQDTNFNEIYRRCYNCKYDYFTDNVEVFVTCTWMNTDMDWEVSVNYDSSLSLNQSAYGDYYAYVDSKFMSITGNIDVKIYNKNGIDYYWANYDQKDNWGYSNECGEGECLLTYGEVKELANIIAHGGTHVKINQEDDFGIYIFPEGIYYGNVLLSKQ